MAPPHFTDDDSAISGIFPHRPQQADSFGTSTTRETDPDGSTDTTGSLEIPLDAPPQEHFAVIKRKNRIGIDTSITADTPSPARAITHNAENTNAKFPIAHIIFFGLVLNFLPPTGTAPSELNPLLSPLALSLGIEILPASGNPRIHLIHSRRENPFLPSHVQQQVFLTLSAPTTIAPPSGDNTSCDSIFFLAPSIRCITPLALEALAKLETVGIVERTGRLGADGSQVFRIDIGIEECSKRCGGCGRWEAVRPARDGKKGYRYRRWKTCGDCGCAWFCGIEIGRAHV